MTRMALRLAQAAVVVGVCLGAASPAQAQRASPRGVGLGVGIGLSVPNGVIRNGDSLEKLKPNYAWGFYVNIPIISSFHIMPHAELYQLSNNVTATDIGMAFKFIVEGEKVRPYAGLNVGGTNVVSNLRFNAGVIGGLSYNLHRNLDVFLEGRYMVVMRDVDEGGNLKNIHALTGILFRF